MGYSQQDLPVRQCKNRIVDKVQLNRVTLIIAETGTGKSSQVPQMLLEEGFGPLLCTQPRRLAVVAISKAVAKERECQLGDEVGFHIGQKKVISACTKIVFETAGVFLEELRSEGARVLSRYKVIIFDEVHERSIESDLALTCIKQFMLRNGNIRLVLMSATFDCDLYKEYFKDLDRGERVEVIPISNSGTNWDSVQFKCKLHYLEEVKNFLDFSEAGNGTSDLSLSSFEEVNEIGQPIQQLITDLITYLHKKEDDYGKNILVFLPTYKALEQQWSYLKHRGLDIRVFVLHSSIDIDHCIRAMEVSLPMRKIILATNVAESSVTIPGISYVIDSCRSLEIFWDNERRKRMPRLVWISKSQADQRKGRTGRTCDGEVFRLVPKDVFYSFYEFEYPAIQLLSLREQVLSMTCAESRAINDPIAFFSKAMSPPEELTIKNALDTLNSALLLEDSHQRGKYSPTLYGRLIASLPLSLESAILVVRGGQLGLLRETAILAALMDSSPLPIVHPFGHELQYQAYLEKYYQRETLYGETEVFSTVSVLLANLHAYEFWQCTWKDKKRLERLINYASGQKIVSTEELHREEESELLWCAQHHLSLTGLQSVAETSSSIIEKIHLCRPNFLSQSQDPPSYYSAYDFQHSCDFYHEENFQKDIMSLKGEPVEDFEICNGTEFVASGHFHRSEEIEMLRKLIGQLQDILEDVKSVEVESWSESVSLCRFFQRGVCNKGSLCEFSHDLTAKRSTCKYFLSETGCRYGEMCEFLHAGGSQLPSPQCHPMEFEDVPEKGSFFKLLPSYQQESILIYGEDDFYFTRRLSEHYAPQKIVATSVYTKESIDEGRTDIWDRVNQLLDSGVRIIWGMEQWPLCTATIPWSEIDCVSWAIKREKEESFPKKLLDFLYSLSITLLSQGVADITLLLTMYTDQYSKWQVERVARDCFFFLVRSVPFDTSTLGIYKHSNDYAFGKAKPVTYVFELLPPSATLHGDCFWDLQQALK